MKKPPGSPAARGDCPGGRYFWTAPCVIAPWATFAWAKACAGLTTVDEILRVTQEDT